MTNLNNSCIKCVFYHIFFPGHIHPRCWNLPCVNTALTTGHIHLILHLIKHLWAHDNAAALRPRSRGFLIASCMTLSQGFFGEPDKSTRTLSHSPSQWFLVDYWDMIFPSRGHCSLLVFSIAPLHPIFLLWKSYLPRQPVPGSFDTFIKHVSKPE